MLVVVILSNTCFQTPLSPPNWPGAQNGVFGNDLGLAVLDFTGSGLGSYDPSELMLDVSTSLPQ